MNKNRKQEYNDERHRLLAVLKNCAKQKDLQRGSRIHGQIARLGLLDDDLIVISSLVEMYAKCGALAKAQAVFDSLPIRHGASWNALIAGYAQYGHGVEALDCHECMQRAGVSPNAATFVSILKACSSIGAIKKGQEIHAEIVRRELLEKDIFVSTALIDMYMKCGLLAKAQEVFDKLPERDVVLWSALIGGYAQHGYGKEALTFFERMRAEDILPDAVTYACVLKACGSIGDVDKGQELHVQVVRERLLEKNYAIGNALLDMYGKFGLLGKVQEVFDKLQIQDVVSWNALICGYAQHGQSEIALDCFEQMQLGGISPDAATFVSVLKACASIRAADKGQEVHAEIVRGRVVDKDNFVGNALLDMYAKCGLLAQAREVFDKLPVQGVVAWSALISGYTESGQGKEALDCFEQMCLKGISPDAVNFVCILKACGSIRDAEKGQQVHAAIIQEGLLEGNIIIGNALVDMYAKCALFSKAQEVLGQLPSRDVVSWNGLIAGYVQHGHGKEALICFKRMKLEGISPNVASFVSILKACGIVGAADKGQEIHAEIVKSGLVAKDHFVGNALVDMYAKCALLAKAREVFDKLSVRDVVAWSALIAGYAQHGHGEEALKFFERMQLEGPAPNAITFVCILKACSSIQAADKGQEIHAEIVKEGLLESNTIVGNALVDMYTKCGVLVKAREIFDNISEPDVVSWSMLIGGYTQHGHFDEALRCFEQMQLGSISPNAVTYACALKACGNLGAIDKGHEIHCEVVREGLLETDILVGNALLDMYAKCGRLEKAQAVFDELPVRDVATWNALISGYAQHDYGEEALKCYEKMQLKGLTPDAVTYVCTLKACGIVRSADKGQNLHTELEREGLLEKDIYVGNALVDMYAKCGLLANAQEVFDKLPIQDSVSWSALIAGHAQHGNGEDALNCFEQMQHKGLSPNVSTYICILKACGSAGAIEKGQEIHAEIVSEGLLEKNIGLGNALVDMYAKLGLLVKAQTVFDNLTTRDLISWNAIIAGYTQHMHGKEALKCFDQMQAQRISPNAITFIHILKACGSIGAIDKGQEIHAEIVRQQLLEKDVILGNTLVDMYAKCGFLEKAHETFDKLPVRDGVTWNILITAYALLGKAEDVFYLFDKMTGEGVKPTLVTYTAILSLCSHTGLVDKGQLYFESMSKIYDLVPTLEHVTCMVDLFGRAGHLEKAVSVIEEMPYSANLPVWHAVLGACRTWHNVDIAELAFEHAVQLDAKNAAAYICMSNIYSEYGRKEDVDKIEAMRVEKQAL